VAGKCIICLPRLFYVGHMSNPTDDLLKDYDGIRPQILARISEFKETGNLSETRLFEELVFCLCTPQSNAHTCFSAVQSLAEKGLLLKGAESAIGREIRSRVRFHHTKAAYIVCAREAVSDAAGKLGLKRLLRNRDAFPLRDWLVENVKGLGYKEASHFLRNVGMGDNLAILDRHILRRMTECCLIPEVPAAISRRAYLQLEDRMREFSHRIGIPLDHLDLLFWWQKTGRVFK